MTTTNKLIKFAVLSVLLIVLSVGVYMLPDKKPLYAQTGGTVIVAAGDIVPPSGGAAPLETSNVAISVNPALVLPLGDNQYPDGTLDSYNQFYTPTWGRLKSKSRPIPGNHDYHVTNAAGYYNYFGAAAGDPTKGYYSYNLGGWHFIALNSERMSTTQNTWLAADLQANQNVACTIAYFHHPRFSSSATHGGDQRRTEPFWNLLYQYKADVILVGHNHHYERFEQITPSQTVDTTNGLRQFVVGSGGSGIYPFASTFRNSLVRIGTHGILKMTLNSGNYSWQFINRAGQVLDSGSDNCVGGGGNATTVPTIAGSRTPTVTRTVTPSGGVKPGDVNRDNLVNILDFQLLSNSFGKSSGQAGYNANADFVRDNTINILDFQVLSNGFGQ